MVPEITLLTVFLLSLIGTRIFSGKLHFAQAARLGMSAMLMMTTIGHFMFSYGMTKMLPDFIPYKLTIIYLTGILELAIAVLLLFPKYQRAAAWSFIAFLILVLPANIYAAVHHVNMETGGSDGNGPMYLWLRIPMQLGFILWTYFSTIKVYKRNIQTDKQIII